MKTIKISQILGRDLKSRSTVNDLKLYVNNLNEGDIEFNFSDIKFATRSFIDEFYNCFLKNQSKDSEIRVSIKNVSYDIQALFDAVSKTQKRHKRPSFNQGSVHSFDNVAEVTEFIKSLPD